MQKGITKCQWCLNECNNEDLKCPNCSGPISVLEPWILKCGWCSNSNRRDLTCTCKSCGGELPTIPGTPRLPDPPNSPRKLPQGYESRVRYWKNVYFLIGVVFFFVFFWTIIFPIIGIFLLRHGSKKAYNQIYALKNGVPTKGLIQKVYFDTSQHINHVHPVRIDYTFSTLKEEVEGSVITWDEVNLKRPVGEHLWVLFNPKDHSQNSIWPPLS